MRLADGEYRHVEEVRRERTNYACRGADWKGLNADPSQGSGQAFGPSGDRRLVERHVSERESGRDERGEAMRRERRFDAGRGP